MTTETDEFDPELWGVTFEAGSKEIENACTTRFSFATTGMQGGDWGHGSRLLVEIEDLASTAMEARVDQRLDGASKVSILVGGDAELLNFAHGLEFLGRRIREALKDRSASQFTVLDCPHMAVPKVGPGDTPRASGPANPWSLI